LHSWLKVSKGRKCFIGFLIILCVDWLYHDFLFPFFFHFPADDFGKIEPDGIFEFIFGEIVFAVKINVPPYDDRTLVDGAGSHQTNVLSSDSPLRLEKLPPCSPELNQAQRFFQELRKELANQIYETVEEIKAKRNRFYSDIERSRN